MKIFNIKSVWLLSILLIMGAIQSCDTFEGEPLNIINDGTLWHSEDSTANYAQRFLFGIYTELPTLHNRLNNDYLDSGTDDAIPSVDKSDIGNVNSFRNNRISPSNVVDGSVWEKCYSGIRRVNVFLANIDGTVIYEHAEPNANTKKIWKAEARFLRAFFYFELVKRWGGVPIVGDKIYTMTDKVDIKRNSTKECFDYILNELNAIENDLYAAKGLADLNIGRATDGATKALRSRVLLYMASPLYNDGGDIAKWKLAVDATKEIMDMNVYSLHPSFPALFYTIKNNESIFIKESAQDTDVELNNSPVGYQTTSYKCKGYTSPSQNLVDAFLTINGLSIGDDPSYDPQNPYENRDPRLGSTVFHNGSQWLQRTVETFEGGLDKPNKNAPQTKTGYYLRKFLGAFEDSDQLANTHHSYVIFRYAEVLLNYAEALNEYDPSSKTEIENALIQIRQRAGINAGSDNRYGLPTSYTQAQMRAIIQNERRIELAFEEHRFWDIRRWKIAEFVMNEPLKGIKIEKEVSGFRFSTVTVENSTFDQSKMYWLPISNKEIEANPSMIQNQGWNY